MTKTALLLSYLARTSGLDMSMPTVKPRPPEWHDIHLTKAQRKGKSFEELQDLRRSLYEDQEGQG